MGDGSHVIVDVYYIPRLRNNRLIIGKLQHRRFSVVFKHDSCQIFQEEKGLVSATHMSRNMMYVIHAPIIIRICFQSEHKESQVWHMRYSHVSAMGINMLAKKDMVRGLPSLVNTE